MTSSTHNLAASEDCTICGWAAETVHTAVHAKRCRRWQAACQALGYSPMTLNQAREAIDASQESLTTASSEGEKLAFGMKLLRAFYDQSLGIAIADGCADAHPTFEAFATMVNLDVMPEAVRERHPYVPGHIAPGAAVWYPADSRNRRFQFRRHSN